MLDADATAQRLSELGCTPEQVERHVRAWRSIVKRRKVPPPPPPPRWQLRPRLTPAELQELAVRLRTPPCGGGAGRWSATPSVVRELAPSWIGHAIFETTGRRLGQDLTRAVLRQLEESGLAWPVGPAGGVRFAVVGDPAPPSSSYRERLPTRRERLAPRIHRERLWPRDAVAPAGA
jgi:hypothetical protein